MSKMIERALVIGSIILLPVFVHSLELHNLELVLEIPGVDTCALCGGFGGSLASGDLNGDGFSDIIVGGAEIEDDVGCVCIYYGGPTIDSFPDIIIRMQEHPENFGHYVAVGDINGDGYDDLMATGGWWGTLIFLGGNPMDSVFDLRVAMMNSDRIAPKCGDLNGDGYDDWVIGAPFDGNVNIYFGDSIPDTIPDIKLKGGSGFGERISSGFDVNADGYDDLFIDKHTANKTYLYYGGYPMDTIPDVVINQSGESIALMPDLTGDGFDDACVGTPFSLIAPNTVLTYWGSNPMDNGVDLIFSGDSGTRFGYAVSGIENLNLDVLGDLCVGNPGYYPLGYGCRGKIHVYLGKNPMDTLLEAFAIGSDSQDIGCRISNAGDINGDGIDKIMFSNYYATNVHKKVWVCKYTGPGVEESDHGSQIASCRLEVYPNPSSGQITISYCLPVKDKIALELYDVSGRKVKTLVNGEKIPGNYKTILGTRGLASGTYFIKLVIDGYAVEKLILVK